jgi:hypothetical protein
VTSARPNTVDEKGRRILFQLVPDAKTVKNRVYLGLNVGPDQRDLTVERMRAGRHCALERSTDRTRDT